jgi:5-methylcytosine-specific restriction endonuclease McrA
MPTPRNGKYHRCRFCRVPFDRPKSSNTCSRCQNHVKSVRRRMILDGFLAAGCVDCGETDPVVLEVHHSIARNGSEAPATTNGRSLAQLRRHLETCEVLCANCHKRRHARGTVLDKYGHMVGPHGPRKRGFDAAVTKMTPELLATIQDARQNGASYATIERTHGVPSSTAHRWLSKQRP